MQYNFWACSLSHPHSLANPLGCPCFVLIKLLYKGRVSLLIVETEGSRWIWLDSPLLVSLSAHCWHINVLKFLWCKALILRVVLMPGQVELKGLFPCRAVLLYDTNWVLHDSQMFLFHWHSLDMLGVVMVGCGEKGVSTQFYFVDHNAKKWTLLEDNSNKSGNESQAWVMIRQVMKIAKILALAVSLYWIHKFGQWSWTYRRTNQSIKNQLA